MIRRELTRLLFVVMAIAGCVQLWQGAYIFAKAQLAQYLIKNAWQDTLVNKQPTKPWPWADTWPVARLTIKQQDLFVLQGANIPVLAFGPGFLEYTARPGAVGNTAILGHRDTHFSVLREVGRGEVITLSHTSGSIDYHIEDIKVVHKDQVPIVNLPSEHVLTLITCFPFDGIAANTPWRYVVVAQAKSSHLSELEIQRSMQQME